MTLDPERLAALLSELQSLDRTRDATRMREILAEAAPLVDDGRPRVYQGETVRYLLKSDAGLERQALELGEVRFAVGARVRSGWAAADARIIQENPA